MRKWTLLALLGLLFGGAVVAIGATGRAAVSAGGEYTVYMPYSALIGCSGFSDDFSDPTSGWPIIDDSSGVTTYINGEYSIFMANSGASYVRFAPTACDLTDYTVSVETRWEGPIGFVNGIAFGANESRTDYYIVTVNYTTNKLQVRRVVNNVPELPLLGFTLPSPLSGTTNLSLVVDVTNDTYTATVDGFDVPVPALGLEGKTGVGVAAGVVDANKEVRFDNFSYQPYEASP